MAPPVKNIHADLGGHSSGEGFSTLWRNDSVRIERIVSRCHQSPAGFWYEQEDDEWVMVLSGSAALEFEGGARVAMEAGDYLLIPRRVKHRVAGTGEETIWLAIHAK